LAEFGFASRPAYPVFTDGTDPIVVKYKGAVVNDQQIKAIAVQAGVAGQASTIAAAVNAKLEEIKASLPSAYPQSIKDSIANANKAAVTAGVTAAVTTAVTAKVDSALMPKIAELRKSVTGVRTDERRDMTVERLHMDVALNDIVKFRFGKFITPAGVWNVDHAAPVILTVRQPLQTSATPIFPEAQLGSMIYGGFPIGDHDFNYNGYISGGRMDGSSTLLSNTMNGANMEKLTDMAYGGHVGLKLDYLRGIALGSSFYSGAVTEKYKSREITSDLAQILAGQQIAMAVQYNDHYVIREREQAVGGDFKMSVSGLTLQAEVNYSTRDNELATGSSNILGWYGLASWTQPLGESVALTPYVMYENLTTGIDGEGATGAFNDVGLEGFSTFLVGLNTSLFTNFRIKTEYIGLQLTTDPDSPNLKGMSKKDLFTSAWSTQVSVAF
jgi:hypothetical protein